jgi:CBS domain-containing protein
MGFQLDLTSDSVQDAGPEVSLKVAPETSVRETFELLKKENRSGVVVCSGDELVGVFTERDALRLMAANADLDRPIHTVMSPHPVTIESTASVADAIRTMSDCGHRRLPVIDDTGAPTGILKVSAIIHYLVEYVPGAIYNLPPDPHPRTRDREGA